MSMAKPPVTLCMIVKNEEEHLDRCLKSALPYIREIIVIDTGSTDRSLQICESYGAKVVTAEWNKDFAEVRNQGLMLATNPWILVLDADEEIDRWDPEQLGSMLSTAGTAGFYLTVRSFYGDQPEDGYVADSVCRLFRNDPRYRFRGAIHEDITESILEHQQETALAFSSLTILHYGYLSRELLRKNKSARNLELLQSAVEGSPDNPRLRYALGTEWFQIGEYGEALSQFRLAWSAAKGSEGFLSDLGLKTVYAMKEAGHQEEALAYSQEMLRRYPDFTDLWELKAAVLEDSGRWTEAYEAYRIALSIGDVSHKYTSASGSGSFRAHYGAALASEHLLELRQASSHYREALLQSPNLLPAWGRWLPLATGLRQLPDAAELLRHHSKQLQPAIWQTVIPFTLTCRDTSLFDTLYPQDRAASAPPMWRALTLRQQGFTDQADSILRQLAHNPQTKALAQPYERILSDAAHPKVQQEEQTQPSLSMTDLQLMLQLGTWELLGSRIQNDKTEPLWRHIPLSCRMGMLKGPLPFLRILCSAYSRRLEAIDSAGSPPPAMEEWALFALAAAGSGDYKLAEAWWRAASQAYPHRAEPFIGLSLLYRQRVPAPWQEGEADSAFFFPAELLLI